MKHVLIVVLVGTVLCTVGCQTNPFKKKPSAPPPDLEMEKSDTRISDSATTSEAGLKLSAQQRFKDVPLPEGLKEDAERTFVYESPKIEIGRMVYTCRKKPSELAQFYVRECPTAGWELDNIVQADVITLEFMKPEKTLTVTITDLGIGRGTELVLLLVPKESST